MGGKEVIRPYPWHAVLTPPQKCPKISNPNSKLHTCRRWRRHITPRLLRRQCRFPLGTLKQTHRPKPQLNFNSHPLRSPFPTSASTDYKYTTHAKNNSKQHHHHHHFFSTISSHHQAVQSNLQKRRNPRPPRQAQKRPLHPNLTPFRSCPEGINQHNPQLTTI